MLKQWLQASVEIVGINRGDMVSPYLQEAWARSLRDLRLIWCSFWADLMREATLSSSLSLDCGPCEPAGKVGCLLGLCRSRRNASSSTASGRLFAWLVVVCGGVADDMWLVAVRGGVTNDIATDGV
jgi:hypothetical protein